VRLAEPGKRRKATVLKQKRHLKPQEQNKRRSLDFKCVLRDDIDAISGRIRLIDLLASRPGEDSETLKPGRQFLSHAQRYKCGIMPMRNAILGHHSGCAGATHAGESGSKSGQLRFGLSEVVRAAFVLGFG
jgi:hypothetical protein